MQGVLGGDQRLQLRFREKAKMNGSQ